MFDILIMDDVIDGQTYSQSYTRYTGSETDSRPKQKEFDIEPVFSFTGSVPEWIEKSLIRNSTLRRL